MAFVNDCCTATAGDTFREILESFNELCVSALLPAWTRATGSDGGISAEAACLSLTVALLLAASIFRLLF